MKKNIKIDLYADISCPWCYIGSCFLNKAIKNKNSYKFKVYWRTFYLNPSIPFSGLDRNKYLENKFGYEKNIILNQITKIARIEKIPINLNKIYKTPNTFYAQQFIQNLSKENLNKGYNFANELMKDYFANGKDIGNIDYLFSIVTKYTDNDPQKLFEDIKASFKDIKLIAKHQINGVPVFIFNDQWTISGAQSSKVIENTIDLAGNDN